MIPVFLTSQAFLTLTFHSSQNVCLCYQKRHTHIIPLRNVSVSSQNTPCSSTTDSSGFTKACHTMNLHLYVSTCIHAIIVRPTKVSLCLETGSFLSKMPCFSSSQHLAQYMYINVSWFIMVVLGARTNVQNISWACEAVESVCDQSQIGLHSKFQQVGLYGETLSQNK